MKLLPLILLLLAGCGRLQKKTGFFEPPINTYNISPDFEQYVELFVKEGASRKMIIKKELLTVEYGPLDDGILGQCQLYYNAPPKITIEPDTWNGTEDCFKEILMMHELGHCKLRRDHDEIVLGTGIYESLMNPYHIGCKMYVANREHYLNELFSKHDDIQFGLFDGDSDE